MAHLIRLHEVTGSHSTVIETNYILLNEDRIVTVMNAFETDLGNTRILLESGKSMFVEESVDEVEDLVNGKQSRFSI